MLLAAFAVLAVTVLLGSALLVRHRRSLGLLHGGCGASGLALAAFALRRGAIGGPFAWDALGLLGAAFLVGVAIYVRRPQGAITLHAALAGIGFLIMAGFALTRF